LCACLVCHSWEGPRWPRGRPGRTCAYHSGKRICITNLGRTTYQFVRADHFIYGKCSVSGGGTGNRSLRALHRTIHRSAHTRYVFPTNHKQIGPTLSYFVFPKPLLFSSRHGCASLLLGHHRPCFPSRPTRRRRHLASPPPDPRPDCSASASALAQARHITMRHRRQRRRQPETLASTRDAIARRGRGEHGEEEALGSLGAATELLASLLEIAAMPEEEVWLN
jgi:hypothetical protein